MADDERATFKQETIVKLLQMKFKDDKTKINNEAAKMSVELIRVFVQEAAVRAMNTAVAEDSTVVGIEHFEKILPQLLLDF